MVVALPEKDPAEYARLDQQRREDRTVLAEAERRGEDWTAGLVGAYRRGSQSALLGDIQERYQ